MLEEHNTLRATVGVSELRWSDALARQAAAWADEIRKTGCAMKHSHGKFGENLYWASAQKTVTRNKTKSTPQDIKEKTVVGAWAEE